MVVTPLNAQSEGLDQHNTNNKTPGQYLAPFRKRRKLEIYNPARIVTSEDTQASSFSIFEYNETHCTVFKEATLEDCLAFPKPGVNAWINVDGLQKKEVEALCTKFNIHPLLVEDILSKGQRAKADDMGNQLFALLPMLSYNKDTGLVENEQLSIVLGENYLISFQAETERDPFNPVRERLQNEASPLRKKKSDYLAYSLMDTIVDDYFSILELLSERLDKVENEVVSRPNKSILLKLTLLRHELMVVKRAIMPVRELINAFWHSENKLISNANKKYFKDIYDHISLAIEYNDNYREMTLSLQDLYMNQVSAKMNEVMKILTIVTTLLAPIAVISSIYGMNFEAIPFAQQRYGFLIAVGSMFGISLLMLLWFRRKGWF
jgi:magnesium transporter